MTLEYWWSLRSVLSVGMAMGASLISAAGLASSPYESGIKRVEIRYVNGSSIYLECVEDDCVVHIILHGKSYRFDSGQLRGVVLPYQPVIYSENNINGRFGFEVRLDCEGSGFPKDTVGACVANYGAEGGRIREINKFELRNGVTYPLR